MRDRKGVGTGGRIGVGGTQIGLGWEGMEESRCREEKTCVDKTLEHTSIVRLKRIQADRQIISQQSLMMCVRAGVCVCERDSLPRLAWVHDHVIRFSMGGARLRQGLENRVMIDRSLSNELVDKGVQLIVIFDPHELVYDITTPHGDHCGNR